MSKIFHVTLTQGRADTLYIEADSKSDVLTFFDSLSTAVISNIKEVVFSKDYDINFIAQSYENTTSFKVVRVFALSENYAQTFEFFNVKHTVTKEQMINKVKKLMIKDEQIIDVASVTFYDEGVARFGE